MSDRYRSGIIGCGGISAMHAANYGASQKVELIAAADISAEARSRFHKQHPGVKLYEDYREMIADSKLDLVSVCTPPAHHFEPAMGAARCGLRAMLLEKPIALNLRDADEILETCRRERVVLAVGHQLRCHAPYATARKLIDDGAIGVIERVWGVCNGAPLQTNATHTIDLMRYLAQDRSVTWALAGADIHGAGRPEGIRQERSAVGLFQFTDGPIALIESGSLSPSRGYHHIYLDGSAGQIELSVPGGPEIRLRNSASGGDWMRPPLLPSVNPVDDLVEAMEQGRDPRSSGDQGRATLEVILALFESVRTRRLVELPLKNVENPLDQILDEP